MVCDLLGSEKRRPTVILVDVEFDAAAYTMVSHLTLLLGIKIPDISIKSQHAVVTVDIGIGLETLIVDITAIKRTSQTELVAPFALCACNGDHSEHQEKKNTKSF